MVKRNENFSLLTNNYIFPEVHKRKNQFLSDNPSAALINLGIGDTTEPLPPSVTHALVSAAERLGTKEGYSGYGPEQGISLLRGKIASKIYAGQVQSEEIFISDGAKCDLGRLQMLFGKDVSIAVQNPSYPVFLEGSLIQGVNRIIYMPCHPENQFFPDLNALPRTDLIYFCSPNNPTGAVANRLQLQALVAFAKKNQSILIFDSAYANFIQDNLPKSIYEIEGARELAIEVCSFSKLAGFTGVRLGWTVIPKELKYDDGSSVRDDWNRLMTTLFNGASNIAQRGGCAVLEEPGYSAIQQLTAYYLENARLLKMAFMQTGHEVHGGENTPYLWVRFKGKQSWEVFQYLLENLHLVTTPGSGFGSEGEGFIRLSAFCQREQIMEATHRIKHKLEIINP